MQALLQEGLLQPVSGYIHDWMHTMASQGIMQKSIYSLLAALDAWDQVEPFLKLWTLPAAIAKAGKLYELFTSKRIKGYKENSKFKCTASEALGLAPLLAYMVSAIFLPMNMEAEECQAFLDMVEVLEMLQATALGKVLPAQLLSFGSMSLWHVSFFWP